MIRIYVGTYTLNPYRHKWPANELDPRYWIWPNLHKGASKYIPDVWAFPPNGTVRNTIRAPPYNLMKEVSDPGLRALVNEIAYVLVRARIGFSQTYLVLDPPRARGESLQKYARWAAKTFGYGSFFFKLPYHHAFHFTPEEFLSVLKSLMVAGGAGGFGDLYGWTYEDPDSPPPPQWWFWASKFLGDVAHITYHKTGYAQLYVDLMKLRNAEGRNAGGKVLLTWDGMSDEVLNQSIVPVRRQIAEIINILIARDIKDAVVLLNCKFPEHPKPYEYDIARIKKELKEFWGFSEEELAKKGLYSMIKDIAVMQFVKLIEDVVRMSGLTHRVEVVYRRDQIRRKAPLLLKRTTK